MRSLLFPLLFFSAITLAQTLERPKIITEKSGNVTKHWVEGSLASTQVVGCIPLAEARSTFTPPDLYKGVEKCVAQDNYGLAVGLFALAGAYASFDEDRVIDKTVEGARAELIMNTFSAILQDKKIKFNKAFNRLIEDPERIEKLCKQVQKIGPPNYYPSYMVLYGSKAFLGNPHEDALVKNFDASVGWRNIQLEYLHCSN